jgi:hypothetical protein
MDPTGGRLARGPRRGPLGLVLAGVVLAVAVWAIAGGGDDGGRRGSGADDAGDAGGGAADEDGLSEVRERSDEERAADDAEAEADAVRGARRAFAQAGRRLRVSGSYSYSGTVHAPAASDARPAHAPAPDVTVEGEVLWPDRTHEVAVDAGGRVAETVTVGPTIWQRQADEPGLLVTEAYAWAGDVAAWDGRFSPSGAGAARLPSWLGAAVDRRHRSDRQGQSTYVATLPADGMGVVTPGEAPRDAEVTLTVAADGDPLRITVEIPGEVAVGSDWRLDVEITALGDPLVIDAPDGEMPSVTEGPTVAEVQAAGVAAPVELGRLPDGWLLSGIGLGEDRRQADCTWLVLAYDDLESRVGGPSPILTLQVMAPDCAAATDTVSPGSGVPLQAGSFIGHASLFSGGFEGGIVSDGHTAVRFVSSLPVPDIGRLLTTLVPYDPTTRPTPL